MILAQIENPGPEEFAMTIAIAVGTFITLGLLALAVKRPAAISLRNAPARKNRIHPFMILGIFIAWLAVGTLLRLACDNINISDEYKDVAASLVNQFIITGLILLLARKLFLRGLGKAGLGLSLKNISRDLPNGIALALAGVAICMAIAWAVIELAKLIFPDYVPQDHRFLEAIEQASVAWKIAILNSAVVGASLSEELLFRGIMQSSLRNYVSPWVAIIPTSLLFAAVHSEPQNMPSLFVLSLILGWSYEKTGSITLPIIIHAAFNCVMISAKMI